MRATEALQKCLGSALESMHAQRGRVLLRAAETRAHGRRLTLIDLARAWARRRAHSGTTEGGKDRSRGSGPSALSASQPDLCFACFATLPEAPGLRRSLRRQRQNPLRQRMRLHRRHRKIRHDPAPRPRPTVGDECRQGFLRARLTTITPRNPRKRRPDATIVQRMTGPTRILAERRGRIGRSGRARRHHHPVHATVHAHGLRAVRATQPACAAASEDRPADQDNSSNQDWKDQRFHRCIGSRMDVRSSDAFISKLRRSHKQALYARRPGAERDAQTVFTVYSPGRRRTKVTKAPIPTTNPLFSVLCSQVRPSSRSLGELHSDTCCT